MVSETQNGPLEPTGQHGDARTGMLLGLLIIVLMVVQFRYQPLSYPAVGVLLLPFLALTGILLTLNAWKKKLLDWPMPACLVPVLLFMVYALGRWVARGMDYRGAEVIGTLLWSAAWLTVGLFLRKQPAAREAAPRMVLAALSLGGLCCGLHAAWQYFVVYDQSYRELLASIGNRPMDRTDLALLYHLKLKRVASIFGDPNALATFCAVAIAASLEVFSWRQHWLRAVAVMSIAAALVAIYFSGSRGGVLDAVAVFVAYLALWKVPAMRVPRARGAAFALAVGALLTMRLASADTATTATANPPEAWQWRSSTITERVRYLQVGAQMVKMNPLFGLGPGSVDQYFGRLKTPDARETKFLHNWVMQIAAEFGLVGLALFVIFVGMLLWQIHRQRLYQYPELRCLVVIFLLYLGDALVQITWNQRELMSLFGLVVGMLIAELPPGRRALFGVRSRRGAALATMTILLGLEGLYLLSKTEKQLAADATYAGDLDSATRHWNKALQWKPADPAPYAALAYNALQMGNVELATRTIDKALQLQPDSASLNAQAGEIAAAGGNAEAAGVYLQRALIYNPYSPDYNYAMAEYLVAHGERTNAIPFAKRAVETSYIEENTARYQQLLDSLTTSTQAGPSPQ